MKSRQEGQRGPRNLGKALTESPPQLKSPDTPVCLKLHAAAPLKYLVLLSTPCCPLDQPLTTSQDAF